MKPLTFAVTASIVILTACSPSETYRPATERQYESADPPPSDSTAAPSDSTAATDEDEDNTTEEVIIRSL